MIKLFNLLLGVHPDAVINLEQNKLTDIPEDIWSSIFTIVADSASKSVEQIKLKGKNNTRTSRKVTLTPVKYFNLYTFLILNIIYFFTYIISFCA